MGVQSWRENISRCTRRKRVEYHCSIGYESEPIQPESTPRLKSLKLQSCNAQTHSVGLTLLHYLQGFHRVSKRQIHRWCSEGFSSCLLGDARHAGRSQSLKAHILWSHHKGEAFGHLGEITYYCTANFLKVHQDLLKALVRPSYYAASWPKGFPTFRVTKTILSLNIEMSKKGSLLDKLTLESGTTNWLEVSRINYLINKPYSRRKDNFKLSSSFITQKIHLILTHSYIAPTRFGVI